MCPYTCCYNYVLYTMHVADDERTCMCAQFVYVVFGRTVAGSAWLDKTQMQRLNHAPVSWLQGTTSAH